MKKLIVLIGPATLVSCLAVTQPKPDNQRPSYTQIIDIEGTSEKYVVSTETPPGSCFMITNTNDQQLCAHLTDLECDKQLNAKLIMKMRHFDGTYFHVREQIQSAGTLYKTGLIFKCGSQK
jgi:hypothetical protein